MPLVDLAVYADGHRTPDPASLTDTFEVMRERHGLAWIGLYRPSENEVREIATEFGLHPLAVEDTLLGHQRAKLDRYGDTLFAVLRPARYVDDVEEVEFGEVHVFAGPDFVVTIRHAESPDLGKVRRRMESSPDLLRLGPQAILYAILDEVVDGYAPVIAGLENDIDEIEDQLFNRDPDVSRRIFGLSREVIEFQRAVKPLVPMLQTLRGDDEHPIELELRRGLRDVLDHAELAVQRADSFRAILENALLVHSTLVAQTQNEEMRRMTEFGLEQNDQVKKVSGWAAILFAPTLVGTIYGMNFENMPELHWEFGYPMALGLMLATSLTLYTIFKRRGWL
ncbi:magnesium and cobalt transport protein CorA [Microbacterium rhizomatis]|uniref:Magnesium and cobalt transport protein CorA n=1 Tax=Microbacterium rhizomatis TaxID=1631477 RepID=A0A5J5IX27_9MICO|nr:magnesium and cobalt transport protein CorA [Microbacterium rhizomatis]KAA9105647.1 magnesium and cobalt transport protein CorA [Microbacterium rhizomatis]